MRRCLRPACHTAYQYFLDVASKSKDAILLQESVIMFDAHKTVDKRALIIIFVSPIEMTGKITGKILVVVNLPLVKVSHHTV